MWLCLLSAVLMTWYRDRQNLLAQLNVRFGNVHCMIAMGRCSGQRAIGQAARSVITEKCPNGFGRRRRTDFSPLPSKSMSTK
jgi:hypothetical protein